MNNFLYRAGDKVKCAFFGDKVFKLYAYSEGSYLYIEHEGGFISFCAEGRHMKSHTHSTLTLVDRQKTKVEFIVWMNLYPNKDDNTYYASKEIADQKCLSDRIACVELKGECEI